MHGEQTIFTEALSLRRNSETSGFKKKQKTMLLKDNALNMATLCILAAVTALKKSCGISNRGKTYFVPFTLWQNIINALLGCTTTAPVKMIYSQSEIYSGYHSSCLKNKFLNQLWSIIRANLWGNNFSTRYPSPWMFCILLSSYWHLI